MVIHSLILWFQMLSFGEKNLEKNLITNVQVQDMISPGLIPSSEVMKDLGWTGLGEIIEGARTHVGASRR